MSRTVGHYAPRILATLLGLLILGSLLPVVPPDLAWQLMAVVLAAAVPLALAMVAHGRHLCERCIASLPLDASTVASRYALRFRVAHLFERRLFAGGYLAAIAGSSLLYAHPVGRYGWAAVQASLVYLLLVYVTHQRLQPWCPHCRNGGDERTAPTAPTPLSTRV
jgi:hypothetical protein